MLLYMCQKENMCLNFADFFLQRQFYVIAEYSEQIVEAVFLGGIFSRRYFFLLYSGNS